MLMVMVMMVVVAVLPLLLPAVVVVWWPWAGGSCDWMGQKFATGMGGWQCTLAELLRHAQEPPHPLRLLPSAPLVLTLGCAAAL